MTSWPIGAVPQYGASPSQVGDYTLLTGIGEGGMGIVHLARHVDGDRVALKLLRPHVVGDEEGRRRLAREVSSLRRVRSRWVAEIVDADPWATVPYVATRYVPGLSLHDHVHSEGPVPGAEPGGDLTWFAAGLAEGIAAVHAAGVLHRDVKPANVLLEGRSPILIDFGLARVADDPRLTLTGFLLGTPGYLAPEILYGEDATAASDVHSWAATVAFAATGRPPFGRGPAMAVMDRVRRGEHDLSGVPEPLRGLLEAALEPEAHQRPTLEEVLTWLRPRAAYPSAPRGVVPAAAVPGADPDPDEDPFTIPLALAALGAAPGPSHEAPPEPPTVEVRVTEDDLEEAGPDATPTMAVRTLPLPPGSPPTPPPTLSRPPTPTQVLTEMRALDPAPPVVPAWADAGRPHDTYSDPYAESYGDPYAPPGPARVPAGERARRVALAVGGFALTGSLLAAAPYLTLAVLVIGVWLLRGGSSAASGVSDRRERRGRRWYDGPALLLRTPWHLVATVPSTVLLLLWSAGLALAAGLVGYAVGASVPVLLGVSGAVLAGSVWWGPGGRRVRSPLSRLIDPVATSAGSWLVALALLIGSTVVIVLVVSAQGGVVSWAPAEAAPFDLTDLPGG